LCACARARACVLFVDLAMRFYMQILNIVQLTDDTVVVKSDICNGVQNGLRMRSGTSPETHLVTPPHGSAPRISCIFVRA
jgi:hypothetical protein